MLGLGPYARYRGLSVTDTAITITALIEDEGSGKKRINVYLSPETADLIQKIARFTNQTQGEIIESAVKDSFFSARWGVGKWALRKP
jgi:hypothetical protein